MSSSFANITAGYARVSTKDQNEDRQELQLLPLVTSERFLYIDKQSGKDFDRPQYQLMKRSLRAGDTLVICSLDRLGRNAREMEKEWAEFHAMGIKMKVLDMPILDTRENDDLTNQLVTKLVFDLLAYFAEMEREKIKTRQAEGIAAAKLQGRHLGRPKYTYPKNWKEVIERYEAGEIKGPEARNLLDMKESTFYKLLRQYRDKENG